MIHHKPVSLSDITTTILFLIHHGHGISISAARIAARLTPRGRSMKKTMEAGGRRLRGVDIAG